MPIFLLCLRACSSSKEAHWATNRQNQRAEKGHTAEATLNQSGMESDINDSAFHSPSGWFWDMSAHYCRGFQWYQASFAFSRDLIIAMHFIVYVTFPNSSVIFLQVSFQSDSWNLGYCLRVYSKVRSKETSRSGGA